MALSETTAGISRATVLLRLGEVHVMEGDWHAAADLFTNALGEASDDGLVSILETDAEGKITRETDYFGSPFEAPEWRRQWVEQMEPAAGA